MKKRILSLVLALVMVISLMSGLAVTAGASDTIAAWTNAAWTANTAYAASTGTGSLTTEVNITTAGSGNAAGFYYASSWTANKAVILTGLSTADYTGIELDCAIRASKAATLTVYTSTDGTNYTQLTTKATSSAKTPTAVNVTGIPTGTTAIKLAYGDGGSFFFGNLSISGTYSGGGTPDPGCTHDNATLVPAVAATCTTAGNNAYYYCEDCDTYFTDSTYETTTTLAAETIAALGHDWGSWTETTAATCTTVGSQTRSCQRAGCNATETEAIPKVAHTYVDGTCTVCGATQVLYEPVTSAPSDWSGEYLIVHVDNGTAKVFNGTDAASDYTTGTISNDKITYTDDMTKVLVEPMTGGYSLKVVNSGDNNGKYMYGQSGSNTIKFSDSAQLNTFAWDSDSSTVIITSNTSILRFNTDSGTTSDRFRYYKSGGGTAYPYVSLYKEYVPAHTHNGVAHAAAAATCTADGNSAYWQCSTCLKYFSDSACTTEITLASTVIPATGHTLGAATNNNNGTHTCECSVCHQTVTEDCTFAVSNGQLVCTECSYSKAATVFYKNASVQQDDQLVIYKSGKVMTATAAAGNTKLASATVPAGYYDSTAYTLVVPDDAVILTVDDYDNGQFHLTAEIGNETLYLTAGSTGSPLTFSALPSDTNATDYALWEITNNGLSLKNVNALYTGSTPNKEQYLEFYEDLFTVYGVNSGETPGEAFQMYFFTDNVPSCAHENTTLTNASSATCLLPGYTGDRVCNDCGETVETGSPIATVGHHTFENGTCTACGAEQVTAINVTTLSANETVYIFSSSLNLAITDGVPATGKLVGVPSTVSGEVLTTSDDAILFTVHEEQTTGTYSFEGPNSQYLTYGSGNTTLTLAAYSANAVWTLSGSNLGNGSTLYLEAYQGSFTTYTASGTPGSAYTMAFYDPDATPTPEADYSGEYYIAVNQATGNNAGIHYMSNDTTNTYRTAVKQDGLSEIPTEITSNLNEAYSWTVTKLQNGNYTIHATYLTGDYYLGDTSSNDAPYAAEADAKELSITEASGVYAIDFADGTRHLSFNAGSPRFAFYGNTSQNTSLVLVPVNIDPNAHNHSYVWNGVAGSNGKHTEACENSDGNCDALTRLVDCTSSGDPIETAAADCQTPNYFTYTCSVCGGTWNVNGTVYGAHNYVNGVCTICGENEPTIDYYALVTDASDLAVGDKIIIVDGVKQNDELVAPTKALSTTQNSNNRAAADVTLNAQDQIAVASNGDIAVITLGQSNDHWTFAVTDGENVGYLYAASSGSNHLKTQTTNDANGEWTISITDDVATVTAQGTNTHNVLMFNNSGSKLFSCYTGGQTDIRIYKLVEDTPAAHTAVLHEAVAANCTTAGNNAYYTCSECTAAGEGEHYNKTFSDAALTTECNPVIAALGHTFTYTDDGNGTTHTVGCANCDYSAIEAHTIENNACTLCSYVNYVDPNLTIASVSLSLQAYIGAQFRIDATAAAEYDSVYIVVTQGAPTGDEEYTLTENIASEGYVFEHKLAAAMMTDNISATVYGVKDETVYTGGSVENWTVKQAAVGRISQYYKYIDRYPQYRAYCVMFADMLTYGAEAQTTFTYATSRLATADVDSNYLALATTDVPTIADTSYSTSTGATTVTKYSVALGIEASVQLQVRFKLPSKADYTKYEVHYTIEGNEYVVDGADLTYAGTSAYVALVVNEVASAWMRSPINITVYDKSTNQPASATFTESVESAANARLGTAIDSLVKAMMKFGDAADGYFNYGT